MQPEKTILLKCGSHRARRKLLSLVGEQQAEALASVSRELGKGGAFRVPSTFEAEALAITGVSALRDGEDLVRCWPTPAEAHDRRWEPGF